MKHKKQQDCIESIKKLSKRIIDTLEAKECDKDAKAEKFTAEMHLIEQNIEIFNRIQGLRNSIVFGELDEADRIDMTYDSMRDEQL